VGKRGKSSVCGTLPIRRPEARSQGPRAANLRKARPRIYVPISNKAGCQTTKNGGAAQGRVILAFTGRRWLDRGARRREIRQVYHKL
jgi:hypothetical protein